MNIKIVRNKFFKQVLLRILTKEWLQLSNRKALIKYN